MNDAMTKHPAREMPFDELWDGLQQAKAARHVYESVGADGLHLYCYSQQCTYEKAWTPITLMARGLIVDPAAKRIVATPFPKFFNVGEKPDSIPNLQFETFEKLDGSLIIIFYHNGEWRCATKGSLESSQAKWAVKQLAETDAAHFDRRTTYLAEAIYPENRIVISYGHSGLHLLGAYDGDGRELSHESLCEAAYGTGLRVAKRRPFSAISELMALAKTLPPSEEGFVLRFTNGLRLKVKGDEYCRIHRLISRITPLAMWEAMQAGDSLEEQRKQIPEEFWTDFDSIRALLSQKIESLANDVHRAAAPLELLTDKEVGLRLNTFPENVRRFIFPYRKSGGNLLGERSRELLFRCVRPDGNVLEGYQPSYSINRVMSEA